jgi:hypothetical protein
MGSNDQAVTAQDTPAEFPPWIPEPRPLPRPADPVTPPCPPWPSSPLAGGRSPYKSMVAILHHSDATICTTSDPQGPRVRARGGVS